MKVSVFTPTYNRGYIIENLYRSLLMQTSFDFEWIVVDDGSADRTAELFTLWRQNDNPFPISYTKVKNGGKHRAINYGVQVARGELFFIVDSDDYLSTDAIAKIINWESTIEYKGDFCGIAGLRGTSPKMMIGSSFQGSYCDAHYTERKKFNILGDKAEVFYTSVLRYYPFVEFEGETFITEATVWLPMGERYKIRYFNEIIYIGDYLSDGLSANIGKIVLNSPKGEAYYILQQIKFYKLGLKSRLASYYYYSLTYKKDISSKDVVSNLKINKATLLFAKAIFKSVNAIKRIVK